MCLSDGRPFVTIQDVSWPSIESNSRVAIVGLDRDMQNIMEEHRDRIILTLYTSIRITMSGLLRLTEWPGSTIDATFDMIQSRFSVL